MNDFKLVADKLLTAAKICASWMRWWLDEYECDCIDGHICGRRERELELQKIETAISDYERCSVEDAQLGD